MSVGGARKIGEPPAPRKYAGEREVLEQLQENRGDDWIVEFFLFSLNLVCSLVLRVRIGNGPSSRLG